MRMRKLRSFQIQTNRVVVANQTDIVVIDKQYKKALVVVVTIPSDSNYIYLSIYIHTAYTQQLKKLLNTSPIFSVNIFQKVLNQNKFESSVIKLCEVM